MPARLHTLLPLICVVALGTIETRGDELRLSPPQVRLTNRFDRQQLLVSAGENGPDATQSAQYQVEPPTLATITAGQVKPLADGAGSIVITVGSATSRIPLEIGGMNDQGPIDFERDVIPVLTKFSCNAGACHGKARGQNGFQLSLLGFDADFDHGALAKEARGRRIFLADPEKSLLLQKPIGAIPHGGGRRLDRDSAAYAILLRWIEQGLPRRAADIPELKRVRVEPSERNLTANSQQQLRVTALYADGTEHDVTHLSAFQSNEAGIATVSDSGLIRSGAIVGEAAIMARYRGMIAVCTVAVPRAEPVATEVYAQLPRFNFIDDHVWKKLERLRITPSEPCADHTFLRRAYIDIIGRAPTADEARAFLDNTSTDRRVALVDHLLAQPEFAEHWANKWADLLRPNAYRVGIKAVFNLDTWIRDQFRKDVPYDQFVRELLTAQGSTFNNGAVVLFRDRREPDELTTIVSQLFLGVRLECAKCHHHPFEVYGQDDFYSFASYFARLGRKGTGLSPPISGSEEIVFTAESGSVSHPLTGQTLSPRPLFGTAPEIPAGGDPRVALAAWITSDQNPYFPRVMTNRVWADLMGRGLVEPVDDLRATNPPSNEALLNALADDFRGHGYNIKHLIRTITTSYVYGLSSIPNDRNAVDGQNYSRHYRQRLRAEVLLDSVVQITEIPENSAAMPAGSRTKEIWSHRIESLFLDTFGRPDPNQDPPCERTSDTTVVQTLHLMNGRDLYNKIASDGSVVHRLSSTEMTPDQIVEELYLRVYARRPDAEEQAIGREVFTARPNRRQATEVLLWALLNTPEFLFKD
ncbi:MAG TPA: DUF1549 and DUF1553 domain-containing protein [Planctomycetaceae bacterium]|nr:DUF1549 and DUF1553 domain-containing protein [Planctomycetaceae bacterium]